MPFIKKLAALAAISLLALPALTVYAAQGDVTDISFRDLDHNGRIERAVVTISNPELRTFSVTDASRLKVWYGDKALVATSAYLATTGDPVKLVIIWNQDDANLPIDTSTDRFAIEWPDFGITKDAPKSDKASAMLMTSTPSPGTLKYGRNDDVTLTFSEPVDQATFAWSSMPDTAGWGRTWSADGRTVVLTHSRYDASAHVTFAVTIADDAAGNHVAQGSLTANPFAFTVNTTDSWSGSIDPVFTINEPRALDTFLVGRPNVITWYTNQPEIAQMRLKWSIDGGSTYNTIDTVLASRGSYVWYAPNQTGTFSLKLEGLNSAGTLLTVDVRNPISLTSATGSEEVGTEANPPSLPQGQQPAPSGNPQPAPNDHVAPKLIGTVVIDQLSAPAHTARVSWVTDELSTGELIYGPLLNYGLTAGDANWSTTHSITISGLTPGVMHNLRLTTLDSSGNAAATGDVFFAFYKEGDVVKATGPAIYWVHDGKRDVFPNAQIYFTWFTDFASVIRIGDEQLAGLQLGTNVKVKGGTKLVKITSDPKTYAVEPDGTLRWVQTEAQAMALYGAAWNKMIIDLDVSLFVNYRIGDPLVAGERPAGWMPL